MWMDRRTKNGQTDRQTSKRTGQNYTNFKRNLAMMVIYVTVEYEFNWTHRFQVRVQKRKCGQTDGQTNGQKMNKRTHGITPISKGTLL